MAGELLCPDCGGVLGATETTEAGPPCTCFASPGAKSDTAVDVPAPVAQKPKICVICGKDVAGHRRLKDSRGYLCYECAKQEQRQERGDRVRCRSCGRLVKEASLTDYEGTKICEHCLAERTTLQKQQIKRLGITGVHQRYEKTRLYVLLGVAGFLLLIILLNQLHWLPRLF